MKHTLQIACNDQTDIPDEVMIQELMNLVSRNFDLANMNVTLRIVEPAESQQLNKTYRNKDKPTNVLSFPNQNDPDFYLPSQFKSELGDLILCHAVIVEEALTQRKTVQDHYIHLIIHGLLHLLGYDHETETEASEMEQIEIDLLKAFNISNPYEEKNYGA